MCIILANPDIAGIGIRLSIYIQTYVAIIQAYLQCGRYKYKEELVARQREIIKPAVFILVSGIALVVSAFIQAIFYGLSVHHALILLALSWLTLLAAFPPLATLSSGGGGTTPIEWGISILHSLHLSTTAGFGLWLFIRTRTFDTDSANCTSSTNFAIVGHNISVLDEGLRWFSIALYGLTLLPALNLFILGYITLALRTVAAWVGRISNRSQGIEVGKTLFLTPAEIGVCFSTLLAASIIVDSIEETVRANQVAPGEAQWTLGQSLTLLMSFVPLYDFGRILLSLPSPSKFGTTEEGEGDVESKLPLEDQRAVPTGINPSHSRPLTTVRKHRSLSI